MITLKSLQQFLNSYLYFDPGLDVAAIDPHMTNGLMVRGREEVEKIGFGVSASLALFEKAHQAKCDALIVHHSFNLPSHNHYDSLFQDRIAYLIKNDISLFGYHFLLDAHPEVGNNTQILKVIGAKAIKSFEEDGVAWGWIGEFADSISLKNIAKKLAPYFSPRTVTYDFGPKTIKRVVALSGMGAPSSKDMEYLKDLKIDLFITGEVHEWNRELFHEAGIHFIAGGHYATEVFGVKALMEKVKNHFPDVEVEWIEVYNDN